MIEESATEETARKQADTPADAGGQARGRGEAGQPLAQRHDDRGRPTSGPSRALYLDPAVWGFLVDRRSSGVPDDVHDAVRVRPVVEAPQRVPGRSIRRRPVCCVGGGEPPRHGRTERWYRVGLVVQPSCNRCSMTSPRLGPAGGDAMTIILTAVLPNVVIQASDRLVTLRGDYRVHDTTANKSIVYVGAGCRLAIGYTGLAYINGIPTDEWIVEQLHGKRLGEWIHMRFPARLLNVQEVVERLAQRLPSQVTVSVGGYQMTRRGEVPRIWIVRRDSVKQCYETLPGVLMDAVMIPTGWETPDDYEAVNREIQAANAVDYPAILARAVQRIGSRSPGVGEDVMVALLLKDERYMEFSLHLAPSAQARPTDAYAPAVIFPGLAMPPSRLQSDQFKWIIGPGYMSEAGDRREGEGEHMVVLNANQPLGSGFRMMDYPRVPPPRR